MLFNTRTYSPVAASHPFQQIAISQVSARVAEETKGNSPDEMSSHDANGFDIADEWVPPEEAQTL